MISQSESGNAWNKTLSGVCKTCLVCPPHDREAQLSRLKTRSHRDWQRDEKGGVDEKRGVWRQAVAAANLDCVLLEARPAFEALPDHLLHELGHLLQAKGGGGGAPAQGPPSPRSPSPGAPLPHSRRPTAFAGTSGGHPQCTKNRTLLVFDRRCVCKLGDGIQITNQGYCPSMRRDETSWDMTAAALRSAAPISCLT